MLSEESGKGVGEEMLQEGRSKDVTSGKIPARDQSHVESWSINGSSDLTSYEGDRAPALVSHWLSSLQGDANSQAFGLSVLVGNAIPVAQEQPIEEKVIGAALRRKAHRGWRMGM